MAEPNTGGIVAAPRGKSKRVLIVDDHRDAATMLILLLKHSGIEAHVVSEPELLRSACDRFKPEVILLDLKMPNMSGFEAAKLLRRDGYQGVLAALTGFTEESYRERALAVGFDHYFVKPVRPSDLLAIVR